MAGKPIYVELGMNADMETLWSHTQTPELHEQWDLRFSEIEYLPRGDGSPLQAFRYRTRIGFGLRIEGTGETRADVRMADGGRMSTLRFGSDQPLSLIREGGGYWRYTPRADGGTIFRTQYDYATRFGPFGRLFDRLLFRPMFGYATAWSFDLLRIWLERRIPPFVLIRSAIVHYAGVLLLALLWLYEGLVPKLLYPGAGELAFWRSAGWFPGMEEPLLRLLGLLELGLALLTLLLHRRRAVYAGQAVLLVLLAAGALAWDPGLLREPFNPLALSAAMLGLCLTAGLSARDLPAASRCLRKPAIPAEGGGRHGFDLSAGTGR